MMSTVAILGSAGVVWSQTSLTSQQVEITNVIDNYTNKLNKSMVFEYVYCSDDPCETIIVVITNTGHIGLSVSEITISDKVSGFSKIHAVSNGAMGSDTIWVTVDGTWLTLKDKISSNSFASIVLTANGTAVTSTQDAIAFPTESTLDLEFSAPRNHPTTDKTPTGGTSITPGTYEMKIQVTGYDDVGKVFSRIIDYRTVTVT